MGHFTIEGDQADQAGPAFHEPILAGFDSLIVSYPPCGPPHDDLFHNISWHLHQDDRPVVHQVILKILLIAGH